MAKYIMTDSLVLKEPFIMARLACDIFRFFGRPYIDIPVGIPSIFEPRPNPLITGPPMYQGSIGKVFAIPACKKKLSHSWCGNQTCKHI